MRVNANALIIRDEKVLLSRFEDDDGVYYTLPGGKIEKDESTHEAVVRECYEEAGVEIEVQSLLLTYDYRPQPKDRGRFGKKRKMGLLFGGKLLSPPEQIRMIHPDREQVGIEWVSLTRLAEALKTKKPLIYPPIEAEILALHAAKEKASTLDLPRFQSFG